MRLTWSRDGVATVLLAVILVFYGALVFAGGISYVNGTNVVGVIDPTGMAALALIVGVIAAAIGGWIVLGASTSLRFLTGGIGLVSLVLGVLALVGENLFNNDVWYGVLAAFMAGLFLLWAIATGRHTGVFSAPSGSSVPHAI